MAGRGFAVAVIVACAPLVAASGDLLSASTQLHRWANGESGYDCSVQCNGKNVAHISHVPDSWPLYSCWGEFRSECTGVAHESHSVSSIVKCEGAFTTVRHAADDNDALAASQQRGEASALDTVRESLQTELRHHSHGMLEDKNVTFFGCEGRYFSLTKVVPKSREERAGHEDAAKSALDLTSLHLLAAAADENTHGHKHHHHHHKHHSHHHKHDDDDDDDEDMEGHIMGAVCTGKMHTVIISPAPMNVTVMASCSDAFMAGKGVKKFAAHKSAKKIAKHFRKAEKHLTKKLTKHAPVHGASRAQVGLSSDLSADIPEGLLADNGDMTASTCAAVGDAPPSPPHCRATCNHHPLAWHGWWPCKGQLELGCEGSSSMHGADVCYIFDAKCTGLSWPKFKACSGLYTQLTEAAGQDKHGKDFSIETLSLSNGFRKAKEVSKHGWHGMLTFGKGPSSLRIRGGVDSEAGGDAPAEAISIGSEDADAMLRADVA